MRSTKVTETPTGRYCFKKKWGGMVIYVEIRSEIYYDIPFMQEEQVDVEHYWRKATEEDLVSIKIVTKK